VILATRFALARMVTVAISQRPDSPARKDWFVPQVTLRASADVGHSAISLQRGRRVMCLNGRAEVLGHILGGNTASEHLLG